MLSLSRMVLVLPIGWLVYQGGPWEWLIGLALVAIATDFFDGRLARAMGSVSEWGKVLDPTADKLAAAAVTLALVLRPEANGPGLPVWFVALVIARDAAIVLGGMIQTRRIGRVMMPLWSGKVSVALLALTVLAVLFALPAVVREVLMGATTVVLVYSFLRYIQRFLHVMRHGL